ncbi:MAG: hypothetical protein LBF83_09170 [Spirochaetaceae bacterium]|jgi:hypothetical protein|nr:hypothetical protein [Spirochaetaceae bacterium]
MAKITKAAALLVSIVLSSCALSKAIYLGKDNYSVKTGPLPLDAVYDTESINGVFPEAVYIKTRAQTFNSYHYYVLNDGLIWYKSIDGAEEPVEWTLFEKTGLPHNSWKIGFNKPGKIVEISADADELVALSDEGGFYRYCFDRTIAHKSRVWLDRQGWPGEEQLYLDQRTSKKLAWAFGKRNAHVLYYEDRFGNQHHNGTMEIATTYVLLEDGQEICYADTGLPADFSRNYAGPERGAFKAVSLSASASTMFVINETGEMYTRLADFDTIGCDPMWFKYTYTPYKSDSPGDSYFSNLTEWGLPAEDWRPQPLIPLTGLAAITGHITILQNGRGNGARELRVAGLNESGETGYWTKAIFDDTWTFNPAPLYFSGAAILKAANRAEGSLRAGRGESPDKSYRGYSWSGGEKEEGWEYAIPNFNILEGDCDFLISLKGEICALKLYPVEMWTYLKRDYLPGRTGSPKIFMVTLEIPDNAFYGLSAEFTEQLTRKYAKNDRKLFHYTIAASNRFIFFQDTDDEDSVVFLTDGTISDQRAEFSRTRLVEDFEEIRRYRSPELSLDNHAAPSRGELARKIELNKTFRDELKYKIRALKWSQLTAFKFNAGYIPAHYTVITTPLRFIDLPKIRTVTRFGEKVVLANSSYIYTVSNIRIWVYEKIIELLKVRLRCYNDLIKLYPETDSDDAGKTAAPTPPRYSENISDYWNIAALPRVIQGNFFASGAGQGHVKLPAVLSFAPAGKEEDIFGWYFSINESAASGAADKSPSIFIDPVKSPGAIYSRGGKNPEEKSLQLDGVLYINPGANSPIEQEIIAHTVKTFMNGPGKGIGVRIKFDGRVLEIVQYPASHPNSLIFRGEP